MEFMNQWAQQRQGGLIPVNALNVNKEGDSLHQQAEARWQDAAVFSHWCDAGNGLKWCSAFSKKLKIGESEEIMNMMDSSAALFVPETLEIHKVLNKLLGCDKRQFKHFKLN